MPQAKPWLPLRATIGLILTGAFVAAGTVTAVTLVNSQMNVLAQEEAERLAYVEPTDRMTDAMMTGDRDAFIAFGDNEDAAEHLARFWDDTKEIGWDIGAADDYARGADYLIADSIEFSLQLGTDAKRVDHNGRLANLTTGIGYYVEWSDNDKIASLKPLILMPWDTAEGTYVERRDNVSVYGFADESELIAASVDQVQLRANHVFTTASLVSEVQLGSVSKSAVFLTADPDRYVTMTDRWQPEDGLGEAEVVPVDFHRNSQGMAMELPVSATMIENRAFTRTSVAGGGSIIAINASNSVTEVDGVAAHELTHLVFTTLYESPIIRFDNTATNLVVEGYATYLENEAAGTLDRLVSQTVKNYVNETPAETVLVDPAFRSTETAHTAYLAAASYLYFVDKFSDRELNWLISPDSGYRGMPFPLWAGWEEGISYDGWVAWLQAQ